MTSDQITVRRRRVVPRAPYTVEEAEYTITVDKHEGRTLKETLNSIDNIATRMLDQKLPLASDTIPSNKSILQGRYANLPWKQSEKARNLLTIRLTENPTGLVKELCEKIQASSDGKYYEADATYQISEYQGVKYLQCWRTVK
jgi:hypothetical protein